MSNDKSSRSSARRDAIAHAAMVVLARRGSHGLTHRAVDQEAGLPQGSTSYYFNARADLLIAAADALFEIDKTEFIAVHDEDGVPDIEKLLSAWLSPAARDRLLARLELFLESVRNPAFGKYLSTHRVFFREVVQLSMKKRGELHPEMAADRAIAQFEGDLLRRSAFTTVFD